MLGKIINLFRYRKFSREHWFRLEVVPDVLSGKKLPDGSLHLELTDKFMRMDITIPDTTVPKLIEWLNRTFPQAQESNNAILDITTALKIPPNDNPNSPV